jgi:UDP-glucose 4-epimerase
MFRKALVTGGAGFIGSAIARGLLSEGIPVVTLDDLSVGRRDNVPSDAELVVGDVRSDETVRRALAGVDIVFHQAARVSVRSSVKEFFEDADINLMGTLNLLRALVGSGVKKLVFASSMAVYGDSETPEPVNEDYRAEPASPYGISKLAGEQYCMHFSRDCGVDCHVLRYFNTYGPGQSFTPYVGVITIFTHRLLEGKEPVIFGDGEQQRDFVYVGDVVGANLASMQSDVPRGIFNVGTGVSTSVNRIADILRSRIAPHVEPRHVEAHPGELRYSVADVGRISDVLGFRPKVRIEDRIHEVIEHCRRSRARGANGADR